MNRRTIGIVGGMGLAAGIQLENLVNQEMERRSIPEADRPRLISIHDGAIADRSAFLKGNGPSPAPQINQAIEQLVSMGAELIAIPCNTAHAPAILKDINKAVVVSLIKAVRRQIKLKASKGAPIGLLATQGTYLSGLFRDVLRRDGYQYAEPGQASRQRLMEAIYQIKANGIKPDLNQILIQEFSNLSRNCEAVILGCTELSLSRLIKERQAIDSLNALAIELADRAIA